MRLIMRIQVNCGPFTRVSFRQSGETKSVGLYMTSQCVSVGKTTETHELTYTANTPIADKTIEDIITNFEASPRILDLEVIEYCEE